MIQRIQTIYLLIAAGISGGLTFLFSLWTEASTKEVFAVDLINASGFVLRSVAYSFFLSALLSVIAMFMFKNRQLQFVMGRINILINLYLLGILIYVSQSLSGETAVSMKGIGMFFPVVVLLLLVLANKAIKKDEDLVKSVDRLR